MKEKINHPFTVLQVLPRLETGGVERGAIEIAQAIVAAGGRALVASAGGRMTAQLEAVGAEPITLPLASKNPIRMLRNASRLANIITAEQVDIVHARSRAPAWSAKWAARRTGRPFVTTYHGVYTENLPLKRRYNSVMAAGDAVIAISDFVAERIKERHGTADARITIIPRGADLAKFSEEQVTAERVASLAASWGLDRESRPVILLPGRLTRWKGQAHFIEALALLRDRIGAEAFCGVIVGAEDKGGRFLGELRELKRARALRDALRIVGHCDDMPAAFRLADIAVSASLEPEAFGRVAVEAQAMGLPIVAAAHGGAMETVIDGATGWRYEPGSATALADALETALTRTEEARAAMRRAAVEHIRDRYSVAAMQAATLKVYERLADRSFSSPSAD